MTYICLVFQTASSSYRNCSEVLSALSALSALSCTISTVSIYKCSLLNHIAHSHTACQHRAVRGGLNLPATKFTIQVGEVQKH